MPTRRLIWIILSIAFSAAVASARADETSTRFCIVPVKGATANVAFAGMVDRLTHWAFRVPGVPAPVFVADIAGDWTIDANRRRVPYTRPDAPRWFTQGGHVILGKGGLAVGRAGNEYISKVFQRTLVYDGDWFGWFRWRQSTPGGLANIKDGDIRMPSGGSPNSHVYDLPTLGRTLIDGAEGLFLFDGNGLAPVLNGRREIYGEIRHVYDLSAIGRVLIVAQHGVYEVTRDGELVARPIPLPTNLFPGLEFVDWPSTDVALASRPAGIFVVDNDLHVTPILGGDEVENVGTGLVQGEIEGTGDMILDGRRGVFLAVDAQHGGAETCEHERSLHDAISDSDLCLRPVSGTDEQSIGGVGGMIEAPGKKGILMDTWSGLLLQKTDGSFVNLYPRTSRYARGLVQLPRSDEIVTIGPESEVIHADLSVERMANWIKAGGILPHSIVVRPDGWTQTRGDPDTDRREGERLKAAISRTTNVANGDEAHIGVILAVARVDFAGFDIVTASKGTFAYEAGRAGRIPDLASAGGASAPSVFPNLRRVLVLKHSVEGPQMFELARWRSDSGCTASLAMHRDVVRESP